MKHSHTNLFGKISDALLHSETTRCVRSQVLAVTRRAPHMCLPLPVGLRLDKGLGISHALEEAHDDLRVLRIGSERLHMPFRPLAARELAFPDAFGFAASSSTWAR